MSNENPCTLFLLGFSRDLSTTSMKPRSSLTYASLAGSPLAALYLAYPAYLACLASVNPSGIVRPSGQLGNIRSRYDETSGDPDLAHMIGLSGYHLHMTK